MKRPAEILDSNEIQRLIGATRNSHPTGVRNRALIILLYRSGLRISEALALKPCDLDAAQGTIRVLHGKGDKSRTVGMDPMAFEYVQKWMTIRTNLGHDGTKPLFCTMRGTKLARRYAAALMPQLARKAHIDKRVHCHGFRHLMAVEMSREGQPITTIQAQLGHARASTTATYLSRLSPQEAIDAAKSRTWGAATTVSPKDDRIESLAAQMAAMNAQLAKLAGMAVGT